MRSKPAHCFTYMLINTVLVEIYKPGDKTVPSNYRQISLTSVICNLDFSKAFDKVNHSILLHKLGAFGITRNIGMWFHFFLTDRSHFVRLPGVVVRTTLC